MSTDGAMPDADRPEAEALAHVVRFLHRLSTALADIGGELVDAQTIVDELTVATKLEVDRTGDATAGQRELDLEAAGQALRIIIGSLSGLDDALDFFLSRLDDDDDNELQPLQTLQ